MRRVRDNSQYINRTRRNDIKDGVFNVLGNVFHWEPELEIVPSLITGSKSTSKIEETPVSIEPDTLSVPSSLITISVGTSVS